MFVAVVAVASVVPVSLLVSMARRVATRTVDCRLEHERQTSELPWPSPRRTVARSADEELIMDVIHGRCAGMDVSKRDAKVCVRIAGGVAARRWRPCGRGPRRRTRSWRCGSAWSTSR